MKKINLFNADKSFSQDVASYTVHALWKAEYKLRLEAALEKIERSISGLENCRGSVISDEEIDAAIALKKAESERIATAYSELVLPGAIPEVSGSVKAAYKSYKLGKPWAVSMLKEWMGMEEITEESDIVRILEDAVRGDSARSNLRQLVNTGVASVTLRSSSEFTKIVYRRLFDYCVTKGTIRFVGNVVKGAGEDIAELLVETPSMVAAKYLKKSAK